MDNIGQIIAYENGELDENETVELFQGLINSGLAWSLQGHYGRMAKAFIDDGRCTVSVGEWSGSLDPNDPDNYWINDKTKERIKAEGGSKP